MWLGHALVEWRVKEKVSGAVRVGDQAPAQGWCDKVRIRQGGGEGGKRLPKWTLLRRVGFPGKLGEWLPASWPGNSHPVRPPN